MENPWLFEVTETVELPEETWTLLRVMLELGKNWELVSNEVVSLFTVPVAETVWEELLSVMNVVAEGTAKTLNSTLS